MSFLATNLVSLCCLIAAIWNVQAQQHIVEPGSHKSAQKIGLAPHDRPACQLPPIIAHRRHAAAQANSADEDSLPANVSLQQKTTISVPGVVKLSQNGDSSKAIRKFDSSERLRQLRQLLTSNNYDAYLVTPNDEHGSEYVTEYDRRLRFISGFTGSKGYALILLDRAVLFTDGRYSLQADQDLDCNWWLVVSDDLEMDIYLWLKANAAKGMKIATDARLMPLKEFDYLDGQIKKLDSEFALISQDLVDVVWNNNNDALDRLPPKDPLFIHPLQFAGNLSWQEKFVRLADSMSKLQARHYIISQLDDIAWLLNLRGNDIPMSPLFKAYLLISLSPVAPLSGSQQQATSTSSTTSAQSNNIRQQASGSGEKLLLNAPQVLQVQPSQTIRITMYVDLKKVDQQVRDHLHLDNGTTIVHPQIPIRVQPNADQDELLNGANQGSSIVTTRLKVELKDYEVFIMDIRDKLAPVNGFRQLQGKLLLDAGANVAIHVLAKTYEDRLVLVESLANKLKSIKSEGEVHGMRLAHWRDSLAISMLLAQLEADVGQKGLIGRWTEVSAANELELYRSLMDYNRGQSFKSISAYGPNGAVVHYQPREEERIFIGNQSTYLLDTGGQYLDGTTDITRTTHYGDPTDFQRETYTRVLMGSIDVMSLIFDQSSSSPFRLNDLIARRHLFELGLDYMHGTGHGIGLYSLVHEAPYLLEHYTSGAKKRPTGGSPLVVSDPVPLQANMFTSVEPGYYKANDFGIRLENIVVTQRIHLQSSLSRPNDRQAEWLKLSSPDKSAPDRSNEKQFLRFEPLSLVPFEPKLMKLELLSNKQKAWLNSYNLMVRLRMTQQINYYLSKIRNSQTTPLEQSNSRWFQQFAGKLSSNGSQPANKSLDAGYYNFLNGAIPLARLQEKLEQTHKWILSKTELLPLDVPQSMLPPQQQLPQSDRKHDEADSSVGSHLKNHRLMLAYMSSLPFNDADAAEASISLAQSEHLSARSENKTSPQEANCLGSECDLRLLETLNPRIGNKQQTSANQLPATWTEAGSEPDVPTGSQLMDLFQLSGSSSSLSSLNVCSILAFSALIVLQLSIMTYMCRRRNLCPSASARSGTLERGNAGSLSLEAQV